MVRNVRRRRSAVATAASLLALLAACGSSPGASATGEGESTSASSTPPATANTPAPDASVLLSRVQGYELRPAPDVEAQFTDTPESLGTAARKLYEGDEYVGAVILTTFAQEPSEADRRNGIAGALAGAKKQGAQAAVKTLAGVEGVESIASSEAKVWTLRVRRYGLIVSATNAAADDVATQLVNMINAGS